MPALLGIMDALESLQQLPALKDNEVVTSQVAGQAHVTNLALRVFQGADDEDRAGKASKYVSSPLPPADEGRSTATRFLAASTFFEVLNTFGALEDEVREKQKYAKWKAGDIAKALREGRTPHAGPIGGPSEPALIDPPVASEEVETAVDEAAVADTTEDDREIERHLLGLGSAPSDAIEPSLPDPSAYPSFDTSSAPVTSVSAQPLPPPSAPPLASAPPAPSAPSAPFAAAVLPSAPPLPPPTIAGPSQPARPSPAFSAPGPAASAFDPMIIVKAQKHAKWAISALNFVRRPCWPD